MPALALFNMHALYLCSRVICLQRGQSEHYLDKACPAGLMQHYIKTGHQAQAQPAHSIIAPGPGPGRRHCSLTILEVRPVVLSAAAAAAANWQPAACESLLELQTGRTHQVSGT